MAEHGKVNEKDLNGEGKLKELRHYKVTAMTVIKNGDISGISSVLSHRLQRTTNERDISIAMQNWSSCESNLTSWFSKQGLVKKGKYTRQLWNNTDNEDDVGKNTPKYIGGYNNLTKRKHNTWASIKRTILENLRLTDDIEMACKDYFRKDRKYGEPNWHPYTDFTDADINKILSLRPEHYSNRILIGDEESKVDWMNWADVRLGRIMEGIRQYKNIIHQLWVAIKYRAMNPNAKSLFKGIAYTRPAYVIDYPLKSKQNVSAYSYNKRHSIWPQEIWATKDDFAKSPYVGDYGTKGVYYSKQSKAICNVSQNWADNINYQKKVNEFEINPAITLSDLEAEMFEWKTRYNRLATYRTEMSKTRLYAIYKNRMNLVRKTNQINKEIANSLEDYKDRLDKLDRKQKEIIRFEAFKMLQGKSTGANTQFDLSKIDSDNNFSEWRDMLVDMNVLLATEVGELDSLEVVVISKAEYNRLREMRADL